MRASASLDPSSRTRLVEAHLDNADHTLLPGMFAECTFSVPREGEQAVILGESLVIRDGKTQVAVIDADSHSLPRRGDRPRGCLGGLIELRSGVAPGDRVAVNLARQPEKEHEGRGGGEEVGGSDEATERRSDRRGRMRAGTRDAWRDHGAAAEGP